MNAAQTIVKQVNGDMNSMDYTDALEFCDEMMEAVEQDWDNEITIFKAADGSKVKFDGIAQTVTVA